MNVSGGVAGKTVLRCAFESAVRMASFALDCGVQTGQWEARLGVIEVDIFPLGGDVAGGAIGAELSIMDIFGGMTGKAVFGRAFVYIPGVTVCACDRFVAANQRKAGQAVIETHVLPIVGVMALCAILAHLPVVEIHMTGCAL